MHINTLNALRKAVADAGATLETASAKYVHAKRGDGHGLEFFNHGAGWSLAGVDGAKLYKTPSEAFRAAL